LLILLILFSLSCQTEDDGRVFPVTDNSASVVDCLLNEARRLGGISCYLALLFHSVIVQPPFALKKHFLELTSS
jgi:hypothetical protein